MAKVDALPLLEVELQLHVPELVWVPDLQATPPAKAPAEAAPAGETPTPVEAPARYSTLLAFDTLCFLL